ncbi:MAG TPA: Rieske 2Fe-2S domain-containing protein [Pirellulales bacterium]|jgi:nitrite reductase/ring-hydroxylating ferredoxin subunit
MPWYQLTAVANCPPGKSIELVVGDQIIALFNIGGEFHALDGVCSHQGGPLAEGALNGCIVTCPWHGWQFDVNTGQHQLSRSIHQRRFETKVENEIVYVELPS